MTNFKRAIDTAYETLKKHGVISPPTPIIEITESCGLKIREVDFGKYSDRVAGFLNTKGNVIYVNKDDNEHRKAFTIAHELGHYLLHKKELAEDPNLSILFRIPLGAIDSNPLEQEANAFAARILVPKQILDEYRKKGIEEVAVLANIFGVSQEVIGHRLKDDGKGRG